MRDEDIKQISRLIYALIELFALWNISKIMNNSILRQLIKICPVFTIVNLNEMFDNIYVILSQNTII